MKSFSSDMTKWAKKTMSDAGRVSREMKLRVFGGIIRDTRVDTGRLRGNWQTSTGSPKMVEIEREFPKGTPDDELIKEPMANVTAFGVDYMTNNLPYAVVYEEKDGMVAKNMARVERNLKEAVDSVRS